MGLVEWYSNETRKVYEEVESSTTLTEKEKLQFKIGALAQVEKGIRDQISLLGYGLKYGKKAQAVMHKKRLMDETVCIATSPEQAEEEQVYCEQQNLEISRRECLSRSGSPEHFEQCRQCPTDKTTRRLLIPNL